MKSLEQKKPPKFGTRINYEEMVFVSLIVQALNSILPPTFAMFTLSMALKCFHFRVECLKTLVQKSNFIHFHWT